MEGNRSNFNGGLIIITVSFFITSIMYATAFHTTRSELKETKTKLENCEGNIQGSKKDK